MDIFNVISLLGGLAMFLYGMRLMGDSLKENSSGTEGAPGPPALGGGIGRGPLRAHVHAAGPSAHL